jgi:hypothetical protein
MTPLSLFGLFAVTAMFICYALEDRSPGFILAFAGSGAVFLRSDAVGLFFQQEVDCALVRIARVTQVLLMFLGEIDFPAAVSPSKQPKTGACLGEA